MGNQEYITIQEGHTRSKERSGWFSMVYTMLSFGLNLERYIYNETYEPCTT